MASLTPEQTRRLDALVASLAEGVDLTAPVPDDPVAVYDIMREAANRLVGRYAQRVTVGGVDDPAIAAIRAVRAEVAAVPVHDIAGQKAMTAELGRRERLIRDA